MLTLSTIHADIDAQAAAAKATARQHIGRIAEAETLARFLQLRGARGVRAEYFVGSGRAEIHDHSTDDSVRRALDKLDIRIAHETELDAVCEAPNSRAVRLTLHGIDCPVILHRDPLPLALAA